MRIGIIVAMEKELRQLRGLLEGERVEKKGQREFYLGTIGSNEIIMEQCGIGKVMAFCLFCWLQNLLFLRVWPVELQPTLI